MNAESQNKSALHPKVEQLLAAAEPYLPPKMDPILQKIIDGSEEYVPPPPAKVVGGDFRKRVNTDGLLSDVAKELGQMLAERKTIFRFHRRACVFDDGDLRPVTSAEFPSWLENADGGNVVCQKFAGRG